MIAYIFGRYIQNDNKFKRRRIVRTMKIPNYDKMWVPHACHTPNKQHVQYMYLYEIIEINKAK